MNRCQLGVGLERVWEKGDTLKAEEGRDKNQGAGQSLHALRNIHMALPMCWTPYSGPGTPQRTQQIEVLALTQLAHKRGDRHSMGVGGGDLYQKSEQVRGQGWDGPLD